MVHSIKLQVSHIMVLSMVSSIRLLVNILRVLGQNILNLLVSSLRFLVLLVGSIRLLVNSWLWGRSTVVSEKIYDYYKIS